MILVGADGQIPDSSIAVHSRANRPIPNTQSWSLSQWDWKNFGEVVAKYPYATLVADACPVYNCHGLTFASRRTVIEYKSLQQVLDDDGFTPVTEREARAGDVVIYLGPTGEFDHSGFVVGRIPLLQQMETTVPLIWSKWGKGPEMIHRVPECDFYQDEDFVRFFRLSEWKEGWRSHDSH